MRTYENQAFTPKERAADLLSSMDLKEKMGQIVCFWPRLVPEDEQDFQNNYPYGAGVMSMVYMRRLQSLQEAVDLQQKWQKRIMEASPHHIPAICHMEGLSGATVMHALSFPDGLGRAASWDTELEEQIGEIIGRQEDAIGINHVFAPVLDVARDPRNGRLGESYGEDPTLVSAMGAAYVRGVQKDHGNGRKTEAVAKHFAGFHGSLAGIQSASYHVSEGEYREVYTKPFQAAITESGLRAVMPCYTPINGITASASHKILTDILRGEMKLDGLAVSDYSGIQNTHELNKMFESLEECAYTCLKAGMDVEQPWRAGYNSVMLEKFESGEFDIAVLDQAVLRILETKFRMGLFEHPFSLNMEELEKVYRKESDQEIGKKSACESMVLLKNQGALPLKEKKERIALLGCQVENPRFLFGGYTHYSMAEGNLALDHAAEAARENRLPDMIPGTVIMKSNEADYVEMLRNQKPMLRSLREELQARFPEKEFVYAYGYDFAGTNTSYYDEAMKVAADADQVIMVLGGKHGSRVIASMAEGTDSTDIGIPAVQEELVKQIRKANPGKTMIGLHIDGRPISSDVADAAFDAILEAWSPAEFGNEAMTAVLSGDYNPGGKLPVSIAYNAGQCPLYHSVPNGAGFTQRGGIGIDQRYVDCPHEARYPFGYGLSYSEFAYDNLKAERREGEKPFWQISFTVWNCSDIEGTEIAQLYVTDRYASMLRPNKELAGFARLTLQPGEMKKVTMKMSESQMAFYIEEGKWKVERGDFDLFVGPDSVSRKLTASIYTPESYEVDGVNRGFFAETSVEIRKHW